MSIDRIRELAGISSTQLLTQAIKSSQRKLVAAHEHAVKQVERNQPVSESFTTSLIESLAALAALTKVSSSELVQRATDLSPALLEHYSTEDANLQELNDSVGLALDAIQLVNEALKGSFDGELVISSQALQATMSDIAVKLMTRTAAMQAKAINEQLTPINITPLTEQFMAPMNKVRYLKSNLAKVEMGPHKDDIIHALASKCSMAELRNFCNDICGPTKPTDDKDD